jgi:hypothetical protein
MMANDSEVLRIIPSIASQIMLRSKSSICLTDYVCSEHNHNSDNVSIHPLYKQQQSSSTTELERRRRQQETPGHHHHPRRGYPRQGPEVGQDLTFVDESDGSNKNYADYTRTHRRSSSVLCGNTVYVV